MNEVWEKERQMDQELFIIEVLSAKQKIIEKAKKRERQ